MNVAFVLGIIILLIVAPVGLAIGAIVTFQVTGSLETETDSYADNTIESIESNTDTGYDLGSLMPLVIAAVALISLIVMGFVGLYARRQG